MPVSALLDITSIKHRALADYLKRQRGQLSSKEETELLKQMWKQSSDKGSTITYKGRALKFNTAKNLLSARAQSNLMSVLMASVKELGRALSYCIDDNFSVFDHITKRFPSGILDIVQTVLDDQCISYEIIDERQVPEPRYDWELTVRELRGPQADLSEIIGNENHGAVEWCMGTGKTIAMALCTTKHKVQTLIAVPFKTLMEQTKNELLKFTTISEDQIGLCGDGKLELAPVTITTYDTFERHLDDFINYGFRMLLIDEAHFAGSRELYESVLSIPAYYRYFFTGTLYREDHPNRVAGHLDTHGENLLLKAVCSKVLSHRSYQDGVKEGYLAPIRVQVLEIDSELEGCGYAEARKRGIVHNEERNALFVDAITDQVDSGKTVLGLCIEVEHVDILSEMLREHGYEVRTITGSTPRHERDVIISELRERRIHIVIGSSCVRYGVNVQTLDVVANVGGLRAYRATLQGVTRGNRMGELRDAGNALVYAKNAALVIDCMDKHHRQLQNHSFERFAAYHKEGFDVPQYEEYLEEKRMIMEGERIRREEDRRRRQLARVARLPKLKNDLIKAIAMRDDPDHPDRMGLSLKQIKRHVETLEREIKSIESFAESNLGAKED